MMIKKTFGTILVEHVDIQNAQTRKHLSLAMSSKLPDRVSVR